VAGHHDHVRHVRQACDRLAVEQVGADRLDPLGLERLGDGGVAEAGDRDDPLAGRRAARHARQRRAHLAAHAEQHDVAVERREVGLDLGRGPREPLLQLLDVAGGCVARLRRRHGEASVADALRHPARARSRD
jgi:hypothetical protein